MALVDQQGAVLLARNLSLFDAGDHAVHLPFPIGLVTFDDVDVIRPQLFLAPVVKMIDVHLVGVALAAHVTPELRRQGDVETQYEYRLVEQCCQNLGAASRIRVFPEPATP